MITAYELMIAIDQLDPNLIPIVDDIRQVVIERQKLLAFVAEMLYQWPNVIDQKTGGLFKLQPFVNFMHNYNPIIDFLDTTTSEDRKALIGAFPDISL